MHDCQKFREDWVAAASRGNETPDCEDCRRFCEEAVALFTALDATRSVAPENSDGYWITFDARLRSGLLERSAAKTPPALRIKWTAVFAAAALVVIAIAWGSLRVSPPTLNQADAVDPGRIEFVDDHIAGLDSHVVAYLGQSELFLRTFTKIEPSNTEDINDARLRASRKLAGIATQKTAAGDFAPVRIALDEYESVLRDIKNMDSPEDIGDIQKRIQRNGLIPILKAYQPRVILVSQR